MRTVIAAFLLFTSCVASGASESSDELTVLTPEEASLDSDIAGKADARTFSFRTLDAGTVRASLTRTESHRIFKTAASFRRVFGVDAGVDFSREWVTFYSAGRQASSGFTATITGVRTSRSGKTVYIASKLETPGAGCATTATPSYPYALVAFTKPGRLVEYVSYEHTTATRECTSCRSVSPSDLSTLDIGLTQRVRAVYLTPADRPFRTCIDEQLQTWVKLAQAFYRDEMAANGFVDVSTDQGKTFKYEQRLDGSWPVVYMVGERTAAEYQAEPDAAGAAMAEMIRRIPVAFHNNNVTNYFYDTAAIVDGGVRYSGNGGSGAPWEGEGAGYVLQGVHFLGMGFDTLAIDSSDQDAVFDNATPSGITDWSIQGEWRQLTRGEYASNMIGASIHELGHAFYLGHVFDDYDGDGIESNLMGNGFRRFAARYDNAWPNPPTTLGAVQAAELNRAVMFNTR